jgi:RNA polymerase sigma factor, sigma-70 family
MHDTDLTYTVQVGRIHFDDLVKTYWNDIWNYAFFLTKKHDLAEDIAQDTFVSAFKSIDRFRGQSSVKTWLLRICRNRVINHRKSAFFRKVIMVPFIRRSETFASAEAEFLDVFMRDKVITHLFELPFKYREVLLLEIRNELSIEEMSTLLDVPAGTVKSRLHRARRLIQQKLEEDDV